MQTFAWTGVCVAREVAVLLRVGPEQFSKLADSLVWYLRLTSSPIRTSASLNRSGSLPQNRLADEVLVFLDGLYNHRRTTTQGLETA